jgi:hypothetical protein
VLLWASGEGGFDDTAIRTANRLFGVEVTQPEFVMHRLVIVQILGCERSQLQVKVK